MEITMVYNRITGGVAEWLKAHAWKACVCSNVYRGFESHLLRQMSNVRTLSKEKLAEGFIFSAPSRCGSLLYGSLHRLHDWQDFSFACRSALALRRQGWLSAVIK